MRQLLLVLFSGLIVACGARAPREDFARDPAKQKMIDLARVQSMLSMDRPSTELGLSEKMFDNCRTPFQEPGEKCGMRYLTVLNFRLTCRNSEGTVDEVASALKPLVSNHVEFQLAGQRGIVQTNTEGFTQLRLITPSSVRGQRLVITVGKQFFGKEVDEVDQLVLPNYWCD